MISKNVSSQKSTLPPEFERVLKNDKTLFDQVIESQNAKHNDQYELNTQLAIARQVFADDLHVWMMSRRQAIEENDAAKLTAVNMMMNEAQLRFLRVAGACSKITKDLSDSIDIHTVYALTRQQERIVDREIRALLGEEQAVRIRRILQNEVRVPGKGDVVPTEPPKEVASFMDATIPEMN